MGVPDVRARLREIAREIDVPLRVRRELVRLAEGLTRASPIRRGRISSPPLTTELIRKIKAHIRDNPDEAFHSIAARFGVNPGRVSEIANGLRRPEGRK